MGSVLVSQWVAIITTMLTGLVLNIYIARSIGPQEYGLYSVALTLGAIVTIFIESGFTRLLQRENTLPTFSIARHKEFLFTYALGHAYTVIGVFLIIILLFSNQLIVVMTLFYFGFVAINNISLSSLRGNGEFVKDASWQIIQRVILLIILVGSITFFHVTLAVEIIAYYLLSVMIFIIFINKSIRLAPKFIIPNDIYRSLLPLVTIDLMVIMYFKSDILILNFLGVPQSEIGHYSAAFRFVEIISFIAGPINLIIFRRLRGLKGSHPILSKQLGVMLLAAMIASIIMSCILILFGDPIIIWIYGISYQSAKAILSIISFAIFFIFPNAIMNQALFALDLEKYFAWIAFLAAVFSIGLNIYFIPSYGVFASAWITVATEIFLFLSFSFVLLYYLLNKNRIGFN